MIYFIKKLPLALSGLLLGITALTNLLRAAWPSSTVWVWSLGLTVFILVLLILRLLVTAKTIKQELASSVSASGFAANLMALALLIGRLPLPKPLGYAVWLLLLAAYLVYILMFTYQFALRHDLRLVYPSWVIVYVGIAALSIVAPVVQAPQIGWWLFFLASANYLIVLPIICWRLSKFGIEEVFQPTLAILAAPTSLLLTAYLNLDLQPNLLITSGLLILSQLLYGLVLGLLPQILAKGFSPLHASLTFPLVNTAAALYLTMSKLHLSIPFLDILAFVELVIGLAVVVFVIVSYIRFLMTASREWDSTDKSS